MWMRKSGDWRHILAVVVALCVGAAIEPVMFSAPALAQSGVIRDISVAGVDSAL
jgi:hypothetical protein